MTTKRRDFLRNIALGIAATLLPRILQPVSSEIADEEFFKEMYTKTIKLQRFKTDWYCEADSEPIFLYQDSHKKPAE